MLGAGFSQGAGIIFNTQVSQDNFMGSGKSVNFTFNNSEINKSFRLGYFNPYWTIDGVARGFDASYSEIEGDDALLDMIRKMFLWVLLLVFLLLNLII